MSYLPHDPDGVPPEDIVPRPERTRAEKREHLLALNDAAGTVGTFTHPPRVHFDVDGLPNGIEPPVTEPTWIGSAVIARHELEAAGLTEDDVPKLTVVDPPTTSKEQ